MDSIELTDFSIECTIGILKEEQQSTQPLEIELSMGLDLSECGDTGDLALSVDYAAVANEITFLAKTGHWRLLETLGLAICRMLLTSPPTGRGRISNVEFALR